MPRLALWTFDEVPGSSVGADSETSDGTSQNGTFQNGATTSGSGSGVFNGSSDYFEIPYDPGFDLDTGSVAITFTQETASTGNDPWGSGAAQTLFSRDSSGFDGGGHLTIYIKADGSVAVRHQVPDQSFYYKGGNVTLGEPTTVIYTWSPTGSQLVVDGVVVDTGTEALTMAGNSEPIVIGATQAVSGDGTADIVQGFFDGTIEGVAIYDENVHANTIPCFTKGTLILTPRGERPIETLSVGDLVCTADGPPQRIRWIGVRRLVLAKASSGADNLRPVRIAAGALGNGLPKRDLRVSRHHRMLVSSKIAARMFGSRTVLVAAIKLTALPGISIDEKIRDVEYIHLMFDQHQVIFAESAPTESFYICPESLKMVPSASRQEILAIFPELSSITYVAKPAQPIPPDRLQKRLVARHLNNNKPVFQMFDGEALPVRPDPGLHLATS
ncbi:Hint domain-containing protein [Pseudorhodobacter turbinis]|uniref:Hint domain-containing protein n=1 Tax=Pseudorhodobacter turbinis TaxID=2500533 RepID=A0A4P8ED24_9RHOB|nr:Hint domain-containing protein [Pseudorhodobacter turbinis]QCO54563.1 Hint domain-containing protein [Pseudorhodobacter turbinis]